MALAATYHLSPNFTAGELGVDRTASAVVVANARRVAVWLEQARIYLGVPLIITRGYSTAAENAALGGVKTSSHLTGEAADFVAGALPSSPLLNGERLTPFDMYARLRAAKDARGISPFDQLIFYQKDNHVHVGLGPQMRGEFLIQDLEGNYLALTAATAKRLRGFV